MPAALLHWTDEGLQQLGQFMGRNGLTDIEAAIPLFERENPPPEPVVGGATNWDFFDRRDSGADSAAYEMLLNGDYEGFERVAVPAALAEVRGQRG